ncbi:septum formation protein Maf [Ruegeria sp. ANG-S4]|uniref:Maf family protein n=1 Tax=Ruegeria sp. ANG-S4 TaxID=1577904 RepID=UPI00057CDA9B|nr:nucleoside triphosphate pyrophosphatase [Ruegeria sp. ANG-S4]KIC40927.1 septum formation protein Maf [Ruegeria sp. ANG-S4]
MSVPIILASSSNIRAQILRNAGVAFTVQTARVDEEAAKRALLAESAPPRDIADTLAEMKARKVSDKNPEAMVIGCDQVLDFEGQLLSKPETPDEAIAQLKMMRGKRHVLLSAAVIYQDSEPLWRHVGQVRLRMRASSDAYLRAYVARNWDSIRHAVGAYKLEEEGVRLFATIDGDYFNVLGMPLLELLNFLAVKGVIDQ